MTDPSNDNDRVLYEIADVFERCGLHPLALYEGLHPLAMEHNRGGLGKMLNSMLGCLQQANVAVRPFTEADSKRMAAYWAHKVSGDWPRSVESDDEGDACPV
jgi:hypothetical protein